MKDDERMSRLPRKSVPLPGGLERLVDEVFDHLIHSPWRGSSPNIHWEPAIDVRENPDEILVLIDLPGVLSDEVQVVVENQVLIVRGKRASLEQLEYGTLVYTERHRGEFVRQIPLPSAVRSTGLTVSFDKGLLLVRVPKSQSGTRPLMPTENDS